MDIAHQARKPPSLRRILLSFSIRLAAVGAIALSGCATEAKKRELLQAFQDTPPGLEFDAAQRSQFSDPDETPLDPSELRPGFMIGLHGVDDKTLNGVYRIDWEGRLSLPYQVSIEVIPKGSGGNPSPGMTLKTLHQAITHAYNPFYKGGARVEVSLVQRTFAIELRGLIEKPGRYFIKKETTFDDIIALAGGFNNLPEGKPAFAKITRGGRSQIIDLAEYYSTGTPSHWAAWRGGEIFFFQKEPFADLSNANGPPGKIRILGEVRTPGPQNYRTGADLFYYLSEAGGPAPNSDLGRIQVIRGQPGREKTLDFELDDIQGMPPLKPGDIVIFHADKPGPTQRTLTIAGSIATIIGTLALLIIAL